MIRKLSLVVALIAATCFAGLVFSGSSTINDTASAIASNAIDRNTSAALNLGKRTIAGVSALKHLAHICTANAGNTKTSEA